jgi:hypothetical protein
MAKSPAHTLSGIDARSIPRRSASSQIRSWPSSSATWSIVIEVPKQIAGHPFIRPCENLKQLTGTGIVVGKRINVEPLTGEIDPVFSQQTPQDVCLIDRLQERKIAEKAKPMLRH